jgi:enoyl-CoA hydratase
MVHMTTTFETIRYEVLPDRIARITLARPKVRNAQNKRMTYELNEAFDLAAHDGEVKVIVLAADGPHFNSGHDLRDPQPMDEFPIIGTWAGFDLPGGEGITALEHEIFLGMCWRWRNIPKPMLAQAQGKTIGGGLMLLWVCDVIIAADDALFADPVVGFGVNGVEYFGHPWELGPRKAKEMLFTGDFVTASDALRLGMVNQVVPLADLEKETLAMAARIASKPSFGLKLAKESVNQALDTQGMWGALKSAFYMHELGHTHNQAVFGSWVDPAGLGPGYRKVR